MSQKQIEVDAKEWVVNLNKSEMRGIHLSKEELERFEVWIADPAHAKAFAEWQRRWDWLDTMPGLEEAIKNALGELFREKDPEFWKANGWRWRGEDS